jgi:hypothetical protein
MEGHWAELPQGDGQLSSNFNDTQCAGDGTPGAAQKTPKAFDIAFKGVRFLLR